MSTVLFQSRNRRGMGHLSRTHHLAAAVRSKRHDAKMHIHCSTLPTGNMLGDVHYTDDATASWEQQLQAEHPDLVVFDTMLPKESVALDPTTRLAFVLRARKDLDSVIAHPLQDRIDLVIVPHEPGEAEVPAVFRSRAHEVGVISTSPDPERSARIRSDFQADGRFFVVSTAGGGGFGPQAVRFFESVLRIHRELEDLYPDLVHLCVCGPNFVEDQHFASEAAKRGMHVLRSFERLADAFVNADLVIAEGGYNTVAEIRLARKPAIFLPSNRRLDDQLARVGKLAERNQAMVFDESCSPAEIASTVRQALGTESLQAMRGRAELDQLELGNERAGELLAGLLPRASK